MANIGVRDLPPRVKAVVAEYVDEKGRQRRVLDRGRHVSVERYRTTPTSALSRTLSKMVGEQVRRKRIEKGLSKTKLGVRACLTWALSAAQRVHEIESGARGHSVRLATLYALAAAMGVEVHELLPPLKEVIAASGPDAWRLLECFEDRQGTKQSIHRR